MSPKRCDYDCGLGQECQWINGRKMCVCSDASCSSSDSLSTTIDQIPLCASNNMTFSSECAMEAWKCFNRRSALYKKYDGECQSKHFILATNKRNLISFLVFFCFLLDRGLSEC